MNIWISIGLGVALSANIASAQENSKDWYAKGIATNQPTQKIAYFTKAIGLDPNYVEAYNARAAAQFGLGMAKEAIQDFNQSIRIDASRSFTFYSRASCELALGKYEAAIADFDQVIQLQSDHVYAMSGKGCALLSQGKYEAAEEVLNGALVLDSTVQSAVRCRDQARKKLGKPALVRTVANKPEATKTKANERYELKEATGMREAPTHTSQILLRFEVGNQVQLLEKTDEFWWKVRYKGKVGYAKAVTLTAVD